jgi:hypothetical protein
MTLKRVPGGWVRTTDTVVNHWRFETGEPENVGVSVVYPTGFRDGAPRGWYCWVYPQDDSAFTDWMMVNCPTADVTHRFNSGDPMFTVHITDDREATLFVLRWL